MLRAKLNLNDFEGFEKYLGNNWDKYYKNCIFYPPIPNPKKIAEYQLNHYAYWMVIKHFGLSHKPYSNDSMSETCYACCYAMDRCKGVCCPIKEWSKKGCLNPDSIYLNWGKDSRKSADIIAHYEWEDY